MATTLTINGTSYSASQRAAIGVCLHELTPFSLFGGYETLAFSERGALANPRFARGQSVSVSIGGTTYFSGRIIDIQWQPEETGWTVAYTAQGLKYLADRIVPVWAQDGTGTAYYNRSPDDQDYVASDAGLSVGQILTRILTISNTATALNGLGIGNYTTLTPPTLPSATVTDLAALSIVPPQLVIFSGSNLFNQIEAFLARWMPKFAPWIQPDGTIRFLNVKAFTNRTLTLGTDPVLLPTIRSTVEGCYSRMVVRGAAETEPYVASTLDGTAVAGWSNADQTAWRLTDFTAPGDAISAGTVSSLTSTGCNVTSADGTQTWATNFWQSRQGWIMLYNDSVNGVTVSETRPISACGALTAGGTASISWSSSWPIANTGYTRYRIIGTAGTKNEVGRLFYLREPAGNKTGLNTWVGSHLLKRFPLPVSWGNNTKQVAFTATGVIVWSSTGSPSYLEIPATLEVLPSIGAIRFTEPVVLPFGDRADLTANGWPGTNAKGLPVDVKFIVPYSRGSLTAVSPSSGYSGTIYTVDGIQETAYYDLPSWIYKGDQTAINSLAQEHLDTLKDVIYEGSATYLGIPGGFDSLTPGSSLSLALSSGTSPWSSMAAPILSTTLTFDPFGKTGVPYQTTMRFSSRQRPWTADDLYTNPAFGSGAFGAQDFSLAEAAYQYAGGIRPMTSGLFPADNRGMFPSLENVVPSAAGSVPMLGGTFPQGKLTSSGWADFGFGGE